MDEPTCRDLIIECFTEAQRQSRLREMLPIGEDELRENVRDAARSIVNSIDEDYNHLTFRGLIRLVARMVQKAHSWGTPQSVIDSQTTRIGEAMDELAEEQAEEQAG